MLDTVFQDVRIGLRQLARAPGLSGIVISTLGIAVAANAALFGVVNATLLAPLPFDEPDRLVFLEHRYAEMVGSGTAPLLLDYRREVAGFESASASVPWNANLTGAGEPERISGLRVTTDFFATLGVEAWQGRVFGPDEGEEGADRVVVVGHGLWQRRFGADPGLLGSHIRLNGESHQVVGIMPPDFRWGRGWGKEAIGELWAPFALTSRRTADDQRGAEYLDIYARLAPGVSLERAQAALDALRTGLRERFPDRYQEASGWRVHPVPAQQTRVADLKALLLLVFGAVVVLLLIAATNVAGLLLTRVAARRHEGGSCASC